MSRIQKIDTDSPEYQPGWAKLISSEVSFNNAWIGNLRLNGVAAAYLNDGCADWDAGILSPILAHFNDGLCLGAWVAIGDYDNYALVRLTMKHKGADGRVTWSFERMTE